MRLPGQAGQHDGGGQQPLGGRRHLLPLPRGPHAGGLREPHLRQGRLLDRRGAQLHVRGLRRRDGPGARRRAAAGGAHDARRRGALHLLPQLHPHRAGAARVRRRRQVDGRAAAVPV
ncbi:hypothetical protein FOCC_FOCC007533 [Frankliniella occidentalis]|nr:hypothetical protein FOCC_FOCC007533 [Frankliniella occidentalis]